MPIIETVVVKRNGQDVVINKSDLHLEPKVEVKKPVERKKPAKRN